MMKRAFYVTQGSLRVYALTEGSVRCAAEFADDDIGLRKFRHYLAGEPSEPSAMLLDIIEEEFALDSIPKLGARDRAALVARRSATKFRRTRYRVSILQGKSAPDSDEFNVLHSGLSNPELVDPWMQIILHYETPLAGIYSVPLMAPVIVSKLFSSTENVMYVAPHQGNKVRQVFLQDRELRSARLSQGPGVAADTYAQFIVTETMRSRRYLERTRLLRHSEILNVCVVADGETAEEILSLSDATHSNQYHFIEPNLAIRKLAHRQLSGVDHFEEVFLAALLKRTPKYNYANSGENRFWRMQRIRNAVIGSAVAVGAGCSIFAAGFLYDVWTMESRIAEIQSQVEFLSETFRRENEKFDPIKADSFEMQHAVDTGDYLLDNRVPAPWVMNQVGAVMGDYPDIRMRELSWMAESEAAANTEPRRPGNVPQPVTVPGTSAVSAVISAEIVPFDGDMRRAFKRIDQLAADLEARTGFSESRAIEYPFDASTSAAISGEIVNETSGQTARFRIRLVYLLTASKPQARSNDEST